MDKEKWLEAIKKADKAYYGSDNSIISDEEYDILRNGYIEEYGAADLEYVPGNVSGEFIPFKHPHPVSSLAKIKAGDIDGLSRWIKKLGKVTLEPKLDGLTVVAYPNKDGKFDFVTRGSGTEGELLPNFMGRYELADSQCCEYPIRGEVYLTSEDFELIKEDQIKRGETPFKQIRNAAAGILRSKARSRYINYLKYLCYDVIGMDVGELKKLNYIVKHTPFDIVNVRGHYLDDVDIEVLNDEISDFYKESKKLYPVDGIVIKPLQDNSLAELGSTGHHPNNAVAWKPSKEIYRTTLRSVEFSVGRNKITPVAIFDPVEIDNTSVTRASIHNKDYFDKMKLCVEDTVFIYKSNEIIPQIDSYIHNGGRLIQWMEDMEVDTDKENLVRNIEFLGKKDVLDIEALSIETARKIVETLNISEPYGIFDCSIVDLMKLEGFAGKSADKLCLNIHNARKNVDLPHFFKALCIEGIGRHVGEILGKKYGTIDNIVNAINMDECSSLDGIGPALNRTLRDDKTMHRIRSLLKYITPMKYIDREPTSNNAIKDKNFVLTGKAPKPRSYYVDMITSNGGRVQSSVNNKTDYLIIADVNSTSTKANKAKELGVTLISPEDFEKLI